MTDSSPIKIDDAQREEIKREVVREIKHDARRRKLIGCVGCLTIEILLVLAPFVWIGYVAAKSGLMEIPRVTEYLYESAAPTRVVRSLVGADADKVLMLAMSRAKLNVNTSTVSVALSESELTTVLANMIVTKQALPFPVKTIQSAIDQEGLELFMVVPRERRDVTVLMTFVPEMNEKQQLIFRLKRARIGGYEVPQAFNSLITTLMGDKIGIALNEELSSVGQLKNIDLTPGKLVFSLRVNQM